MDALDARILRELGMEPFAGWPHRVRGLKVSEIAQALGVGHQLVKDRIAKMRQSGVIVGFGVTPNLRHFGLAKTVYLVPSHDQPEATRLAPLRDVDGLQRVIWFLDCNLCVEMTHQNTAERQRRMQVVARLSGSDGPPAILYEAILPPVTEDLSNLDLRIIAALAPDAKRPLAEVATETHVSEKTIRTRLAAMRRRGSIDEHALLDLSKMEGIIPFQIAVWTSPGHDPRKALLDHFDDRLLAAFTPPTDGGYCSFLLRVFASTPVEVQRMVGEARDVPGVERAEPMMATGGIANDDWLRELLERQLAVVP